MFFHGIILMVVAVLAAAASAVPNDSLGGIFSRLMMATFQKTKQGPNVKVEVKETGTCGNHCFFVTEKGVGLILDVGEDYIDPQKPCKLYVCKEGGLTQQKITCTPVDEIEPCANGNPPFISPGECCAHCGGNFTDWTEWTACSASCGGGARTRTRECEIIPGVSVECMGDTSEVQPCNVAECPPECQVCRIPTHENYMECIEDSDGDCVSDPVDNCRNAINTDQSDQDNDSVGNICDNCPSAPNSDQLNSDGDRNGDSCDLDDDNDGIPDAFVDNCQFTPNPSQTDTDADRVGDACDNCLVIPNTNQNDYDEDGVGNACDNCRYVYNPEQGDPAEFGDRCNTRSSTV